MIEAIIFAATFGATAAGIWLFIKLGTSAGSLDLPNERSSHETPTLRGAGLVIVLVCLGLYVAVCLSGSTPCNWGYASGAVAIAVISLIDDRIGLSPFIRIPVHALAAAAVVLSSTVPAQFHILIAGTIEFPEWIAASLAFVWIVWMINAYNFMDGIDGIAGAQAVAAGTAWGALALLIGDWSLYAFALAVGFSAMGFLLYNWSPARVFMGDVGSAYLGFTFASMPLLGDPRGRPMAEWLFPAAVCFLWPFVFDTVVTFCRRLVKGERVWEAHRQHLYQRLVISGMSHTAVTLLYGSLAITASAAFLAGVVMGGTVEVLALFVLLVTAAIPVLCAHRKKD